MTNKPQRRATTISRMGRYHMGGRKESVGHQWLRYVILSKEEEEDLRTLRKVKDPSRLESNRLQRLERRNAECLIVPSEGRWAVKNKVETSTEKVKLFIDRRRYWVVKYFMWKRECSRREAVLLAHERLGGIVKDIEETRDEVIDPDNIFYEGSG